MAQRQKYFYANKDRDGFPVPGTMMSYDRPLNLNKVKNKLEIKNSYTVLPCQTLICNKRGLRYFVEVDSYGDIIPNRLFSALYPPKNIKYVEILNIIGTPCVTLSMKNFLSTDTPGYPVGVWNTAGTYLGTAVDQTSYVTLWNSDVTNQSQGTLLVGPTPTEFYILDTPSVTVSFVRALRYYRYTGQASLEIFVGLNDIIKYGVTTKTGLANAVPTNSDTRQEWNRILINSTYNTKIPTTTVYVLTCTGNPNATPVFVFHNEDSQYVGVKYNNPNGGAYSIYGALPIATKAMFLRSSNALNYNDVNNWPELTSLFSFINVSAGGGVWSQNDPAKWPSTINGSQITQVQIGQFVFSNTILTVAPYMTQLNYPNVAELVFDTNSATTTYAGAESWFLNMPKLTKYLSARSQVLATTATADLIWNNIATNLTGIVPVVGSQKELRVRTTTAVSAASLTSRTYLAAQGWTVSLS